MFPFHYYDIVLYKATVLLKSKQIRLAISINIGHRSKLLTGHL